MAADPPPRSPDDRERFEAVYRSCRDDLLGYALRRTEQPSEAADVVADAFLIAWNRITELPRDTDQARPWLFGVARRVLANRRRSSARRTRLAHRLRAELARTTVAPPTDASLVDIGRVFRSLRDADRELLSLTAWEGLEIPELAVALGSSRNAARIRLHRARKRFANALRAAGINPGIHAPAPELSPSPRLREEPVT